MESRVRGSAWAAWSRASSHPGAAPERPRTLIASMTVVGSRDQPAAHSPVLHLHRAPGGRLFEHYARSYERVWDQAREIR